MFSEWRVDSMRGWPRRTIQEGSTEQHALTIRWDSARIQEFVTKTEVTEALKEIVVWLATWRWETMQVPIQFTIWTPLWCLLTFFGWSRARITPAPSTLSKQTASLVPISPKLLEHGIQFFKHQDSALPKTRFGSDLLPFHFLSMFFLSGFHCFCLHCVAKTANLAPVKF